MGANQACCQREGGGDGKIDPRWRPSPQQHKRSVSGTWAIDGLPPSNVNNARSLAAAVLAEAKRGRTERIEQMLEAENIDAEQATVLLDATDLAHGNTALMLAARGGHDACCRLLLTRGADPLARNRDGHSAADLAAAVGNLETAAIIDAENHPR